MKQYPRLDETNAYKKLLSLAGAARPGPALDAARVERCQAEAGGGLRYSWAAMDVDDAVFSVLEELAAESMLLEQYRALASGEIANPGENRMVLHHLTRGEPAGKVVREGRDYRAFYEGERKRFSDFAAKVRSGAIQGSTGKRFETVVQIGIGGSDLGPRALYLALEQWAREKKLLGPRALFISNVDPDDANATLAGLDPETSLFVLVSKSGTTQETLANEAFVMAAMRRSGVKGLDPARHMVAVTSETSPLAKNPAYLDSFYIDDFIGGRYSSSSAVGGVILSVALGPEAFAAFLEGAAEADRLAMETSLARNPAMLDALAGVYERNALGRDSTAVLPYAQALSRFPAHLQQLDMESNGKHVDRQGRPVGYATGPVIFGEPGTNGQHSFYQLLHQGTDVIPLQFVGFLENQTSPDPEFEGSTSRVKLNANLAAQIVAFSKGQADDDPNRRFEGGRPSSLLWGKTLDPRALGALLAHFENKVMFQGFAWNLNSFDQEGVQLGKKLTKKVLSPGAIDPALDAFARLLGARA